MSAASSAAPQVFDRALLRRRRDRAALRYAGFDFLAREVGDRLADRLADVRRRFPLTLDLGCRNGTLAQLVGERGGIETLVQSDLSPAMAAQAAAAGRPALAADEEALPFGPAAFDLVLSSLALHWVNDLPGTLAQIRWCLKPDGLFLAALFGGETLKELRQALLEAEVETTGGASPRISPFLELRDAGMLLQRAGFALPVADADTIPVSYEDPLRLLQDLRGMGESNAAQERRRSPMQPTTLLSALERYPRQADGRITATFQVIYLTGWAPHATQQQPLRPGSARSRLADALESEERRTGVRPDRSR